MSASFEDLGFLVVSPDGEGRWVVWHSPSMATFATFTERAEAADAAETAADVLGLPVRVEPAG